MKKVASFTIAIISSLLINAQSTEVAKAGAEGADKKENDTLKIKWRGSRIWIFDAAADSKNDTTLKVPKKPHKKEFAHWAGIDLGSAMLTTVDNKLRLSDAEDTLQINDFLELNYTKSVYFSLNLLETNIPLYKNYVNFVTGLGFEWNSYNFKENITLDPDADYIGANNTITAPSTVTFSKNKLKVAYIKAPLLLEINTNSENPRKSFHIAGGVEVGYKIGSKTKQVYETGGYEYTVKQRGEYHLADLKYSSTVRIGYGDYVTVFANYGLSQLFEKDKGPDVYPFTAGISFNF